MILWFLEGVTFEWLRGVTFRWLVTIVEGMQAIDPDEFESCEGGLTARDAPCYDFGKKWWEKLGGFLGGIFGSIFGGDGEGNAGGGIWIGTGGSAFPYYNSGNNNGGSGGGGGSGSTALDGVFGGTFFNGQGEEAIIALEEIIGSNDLAICIEDLHSELSDCLSTQGVTPTDGPPPPPGDMGDIGNSNEGTACLDWNISTYIYALNGLEANDPCLTSIINNYQTDIDLVVGDGSLYCLIQEINTYGISDEDLFYLVRENNCTNSGAGTVDEECIVETLEELFDGEEKEDELDPDMWPDCESWEYVDVAGGVYQSCGVIGIDIDVKRTYVDSEGTLRSWHRGYLFNTIYFEFPRIRDTGFAISPGLAAMLTAQMVHEAEDLAELEFANYTQAPSSFQLRVAFETKLNQLLAGFGARASKNPHYGPVPINPASYILLGYGNCQ